MLLHPFVRAFTDHNSCAILFVRGFQPRAKINAVSDNSIIESICTTHVSYDDFSRIDADTHVQDGFPFVAPEIMHSREGILHLNCSSACEEGMIGLRNGSAPKCHDGVSFILVESPVIVEDDHCHHAEIFV